MTHRSALLYLLIVIALFRKHVAHQLHPSLMVNRFLLSRSHLMRRVRKEETIRHLCIKGDQQISPTIPECNGPSASCHSVVSSLMSSIRIRKKSIIQINRVRTKREPLNYCTSFLAWLNLPSYWSNTNTFLHLWNALSFPYSLTATTFWLFRCYFFRESRKY